MPKRITNAFEMLLLGVVILSILLGMGWMGSSAAQSAPAAGDAGPAAQPAAGSAPQPTAAATAQTELAGAPPVTTSQALSEPADLPAMAVATPVPFDPQTQLDAGDAPLLQQAPGTINILVLGADASVSEKLARTDTMIIASINPDLPSVSMLSLPRDLQVRIAGGPDDRLNTAYELGYIRDYPGGGPAHLAAVLRKNFGIQIDHYVRVDFGGFIKAIDTLGGVDVLVECELHDTFPDKESRSGSTDLDLLPGKAHLSGKEALWYSRSRWSTTDFDRARRQQKVLRALFNKAKSSNLLQNAISLYGDFREHVETSVGLGDIPFFVEIASRMDDLAMKSRVLTFPIVKAYTRRDGARVLLPTEDTIPFIAEALSPPAGNQAQSRPAVEVVNASTRDDMEWVATERLVWEGFQVTSVKVAEARDFEKTQIFDYAVTAKGSPISRLASIFRVRRDNIIAQPDPSSAAAATIVLGEDYDSCPATATIAGDVPLAPAATEPAPEPAPEDAPDAAPADGAEPTTQP
jgi:LCP family protein required for cell wall assembly